MALINKLDFSYYAWRLRAPAKPNKAKPNNAIVDGSGIEDHGDSHSSDGFCNATRKAKVSGTFEGDKFLATSFTLIDNKKKKKKK